MSTSIKVELPPGCAEKIETFKCNETSTIKEVVQKITSDLHLSLPDLWGLYIPSTKESPAKWLEPTSTVADNKLSKVNSVLKRNYIKVQTTFYNGNFFLKVLAFPVFVPLGEWLPYVAHKFGMNSVEDYNLYIIGKPDPLPLDKALKDISIPERSRFIFKNSSNSLDPTSMKIFHDLQERQLSRGTKQKHETTDIPLDFDLSADVDKEASAATLLINLPLNGYLSILKKKKWERYFCILIGYHLFFYKTQNDPKPTLVIPLIDYTPNLIDEKKKKIPFGIDIVSNDKKEVITTKADQAKLQQIWYEAIIKEIGEAKNALEEKKNQAHTKSGKPTVFCAPLEDQVEKKDGSELPKIIPMCIEFIEERALDCEGIFRLSGSAVLIQEYKAKFDNHESVNFENESDPHAISGLFKLYFRELPEPVMTWHQYDDFIIAESISNPGLRLRYMKYLIDKLPPINRAILRTLVSFLRKVNERSHINKMPIHNIATVFGPNLLRQKDANMLQMVEDTAQINSIVNILINYDGYLLNDRPPPEESEEDQMIGTFAKAIYDYDGAGEDDLPFKKNAIISVIIQGVDGWWKGESEGKFGKFPASYVQVLTGDALQKNMRRVRFKQDMIRLKKAFVDEDKLLEVLENQKKELQVVQKELNEQYGTLEKIYIDLASPVVKSVNKDFSQLFPTKIHKLHENLTALNLLHDEIADSRDDLMEEMKEATKEIANDKDKKKKLDKKQEKAVETILGLCDTVMQQFTEEQKLHRNVVKNESEIQQHLIPMGTLSNFFSQI